MRAVRGVVARVVSEGVGKANCCGVQAGLFGVVGDFFGDESKEIAEDVSGAGDSVGFVVGEAVVIDPVVVLEHPVKDG